VPPPAPPPAPAPLIGRLAPSPTGRLHLGHARTFLAAWWHARARGGRVLLRLEDLDRARARPEHVDECLRDLEWLGLDWDGTPWFQSADTAPMAAAVERLLAAGQAYLCACSRKDVERLASAPHASDGEVRYPGTCRARALGPSAGAAGLGVRLRVPAGPLELEDGFAGRFRCDVQAEVGDFLLARRDGAFAYQLAVVVDDARAGVSEVLRGDDLLSSAARQWHLQCALALPHPHWFHLPLVLDERGERLAKRRGDTSLAGLRAAGVDGRAVVAWAARSLGQACAERVRADELRDFSLARVPRAPVRLEAEALAHLVAAQ